MDHLCEWTIREESVPNIDDRIEEKDAQGRVTGVTYGERLYVVATCTCGNRHSMPGVLAK